MTLQVRDIIKYQGEKKELFEGDALEPLLTKIKIPPFYPPDTSNWRGYTCNWEIMENKLYLVKFKGYLENNKKVDLSFLFDNKKKVFANWYSGELTLLNEDKIYFNSFFDNDDTISLKVKQGIIVKPKLRN